MRESDASKIQTFSDLVGKVASISFQNPRFSLFFRGQDRDYRNDKSLTTMYPEIYRDLPAGKAWNSNELVTRFDFLHRAAEFIPGRMIDIDQGTGIQQVARFQEIGWAILQHYDVCSTPLIDVTHSLRVAASFARPHNHSPYGFVFVVGLPHVNGSITYSVEDELLNIKLLSIVPPAAKRPHFQEGYLVGSFPSSQRYGFQEYDLGRRLIAKFHLCGSRFWTDDFPPIPHGALHPPRRPILGHCRRDA